MADKLGLDEARIMVDAMLTEASKRGLNFAGAVTDAGGDLIHLSRMDNASALNARIEFPQGLYGGEVETEHARHPGPAFRYESWR